MKTIILVNFARWDTHDDVLRHRLAALISHMEVLSIIMTF